MVELNDNNFKKEIENKRLVLVDFYATWCGPCSMQAEVLEKMSTSRNSNFDIVKVNVDDSPSIAMEYGIESIPTLMIFKDNKLVSRKVGYTKEEEILKIISKFED